MILIGVSPFAMVHVNVILSPFCRLDVRREKGTILGATRFFGTMMKYRLILFYKTIKILLTSLPFYDYYLLIYLF